MPRIGDKHYDITQMSAGDIASLPNDAFRAVLQNVIDLQRADRKENQLLYYKPASEKARKVHFSKAKYVGVSGGNRSGKSETVLAHFAMLATGTLPIGDDELAAEMRRQFRGPINLRTVVESFTTTLYPIILPKLQYFKWSGQDVPGGDRGHWGWIPKNCLIDGSWERSWQEKTKTLTMLCRDPDNPARILGHSVWQFMSKDQDPSDFASGTFHLIHHDEPPLFSQFRENQARTIEAAGRIFLAFTWPDDPSMPVDWIFDDMYEPATRQDKSPDHDWIELWTTENLNLDQASVAQTASAWSEEEKRVRLYGGSMRFSNRIHPDFTDTRQFWCFTCKRPAFLESGRCAQCGNNDIEPYCHVQEFDIVPGWPAIFCIDPHPRKPHMWMWAQVDPADDILFVAEGELAGGPTEVAKMVFDAERTYGLNVVHRLIDPNMGRSPSTAAQREKTWQDEFDGAGLVCDLADDSGTGRTLVNDMLKPDPHTRRPRMLWHARCTNAAYQMKRYTWDDWKQSAEKDQKQKPRAKYDDYPTLSKYIANFQPNFQWLKEGAPVIGAGRKRRGAY